MSENLKERQENELEVLQAIYMDDFKDLRSEDEHEDIPAYYVLQLKPCESMRQNESHVSMDLMVKYSKEYPNRSPILKLQNIKGLPNDKVTNLETEIKCMAADRVGEVMVFEIAQRVQDFLHKNNRAPLPSFYEEMMQKKQQDFEQRQAAEKEKREKERQANVIQIEREEQQIREEMTRREEALKSLKKRNLQEKENFRVELLSQSKLERRGSDEVLSRERNRQKSSSEETIPYDGLRVVTFQSNKKQHIVHRGKCLGCGTSGALVFCGLDILTGHMVLLTEWKFKNHPSKRGGSEKMKFDDEKLLKQVSSIDQEVSSLITRVNHINLVHYLAVQQQQETNMITLQILCEFVCGVPLHKELRPGGLPIDIIKEYGQQLLEIIVYLHSKSIVHKDIRLSSIFIDQDRKIRLADYSIGRRLRDLYQIHGHDKASRKTATVESKASQKYNKKSDILHLGLVLLSLLEGRINTSAPPNLSKSLPAELQDFLTRCLYPDDKEQWTASQLLHHTFIVPPIITNPELNTTTTTSNGIDQQPTHSTNTSDGTGHQDVDTEHEIPSVNVISKSRLKNEFEVSQFLGEGGFGSVVKVRNKLDGCLYAIKIIRLNPRSVQFNRKITREVKLLSRLNHENIVRYYNSWIEVDEETTTSEEKCNAVAMEDKRTSEDSLLGAYAFEEPSIRGAAENDDDLSWGSYKDTPDTADNYSSSESLDSDDDDNNCALKMTSPSPKLNDSSDDIMFTGNIDDSFRHFGTSLASEEESDEYESDDETRTSEETSFNLQYLYIQMEYCEKSTLRSEIDNGLYMDHERGWRLLREIVEGLVHVHSQGMIHRDLKPVNIFLDSNDRVKIGDFGLATTHPFTIPCGGGGTVGGEPETKSTSCDTSSIPDSMTGKVGTALYVSPELGNVLSRTRYTAKVDLYSLGIIFFEMCYRPLETKMERSKILGNLRTEKIILPEDFDTHLLEKQAFIISWLLRHNPDQRPTSQELLKSQHIPPKIEDSELEEILNHTLATTNSTRYRTLISYVMNQDVDQHKLDLTYDYDLVTSQFSGQHAVAEQRVYDTIVQVFRQHGLLMLNTPLLVPKTKLDRDTDTRVSLMDHSGAILTLPYDLRTMFARYLARNNFPSLKRYSIGRVYRDTRILGVHPREHCECAVDIVTGAPCDLVPDAEILCIVAEVIDQFTSLATRNFYIRINHSILTKSILTVNGVPEDRVPDVIVLLQETRLEHERFNHLTKFLESLNLSEHAVNKIRRCLLTEIPLDVAKSALAYISRGRRTVNHRARNAIQDLEKLIAHARRMGLTLKVVLSPCLVYNIQHMSGPLFQFVATRKRKTKVEILAAGGRYNNLIALFTRGRELPHGYGAVGASINVDRIIQCVAQESETGDWEEPSPDTCEVLVCAVGDNQLLVERMTIVQKLRSQLNMSASIWYEQLTDAMLDERLTHCRNCGINYMVIVEENAPTMIKIINKDKEIKGVEDPVEFLRQKFQEPSETFERGDTQPYVSSSKTPSTVPESTIQHVPKFNIEFVSQEKMERNMKRRYEAHMISKVTHIVQSFVCHKNPYLIIGVDLPISVLNCISTVLDVSSEEAKFTSTVLKICEQNPKYKKHIPTVCDKILEEITIRALSILFLFSYTDEQCVVMSL